MRAVMVLIGLVGLTLGETAPRAAAQGGGPPAAPGNLRLAQATPASLAFVWDPSPGATLLWAYAPDDGGYTQLAGGATSFALANLAPASSHCLIVIAYNDAGYSGWSNWACETTPARTTSTSPPPVAPPPAATPTPNRAGCSPAYPTVCIPPPPPDLDCAQIPFRDFPVLPPDPHGFDTDRDGIGCESPTR